MTSHPRSPLHPGPVAVPAPLEPQGEHAADQRRHVTSSTPRSGRAPKPTRCTNYEINTTSSPGACSEPTFDPLTSMSACPVLECSTMAVPLESVLAGSVTPPSIPVKPKTTFTPFGPAL